MKTTLFSRREALIFVGLFAFLGVAFLFRSYAATGLTIDSSLPVPQNVRAYGDDRNIIVTWDQLGNGEDLRVIGYYVTYRPKGSNQEYKVVQQKVNRNWTYSIDYQTAVQLQTLENGVEYEINVQAASGSRQSQDNGSLVGGGGSTYYVGDGKVSQKATTYASPSSARVDDMRNRLTSFFDDFNQPAGPFDELKWNTATTACVSSGTAAAFLNDQFHSHNQLRSACDRGGIASRARGVFDITGATEDNPAIIQIDVDGASQPRDTWYLDIIPLSARPDGNYPIDITSHNDLFDQDGEDPGNMVRINSRRDGTSYAYYSPQRRPVGLANANDNGMPAASMRSPLPVPDIPKTTPNVRSHWLIEITPTRMRVLINGKVSTVKALPPEFTSQKQFSIHSTMFSYNTGKDYDQVRPYVQLLHWDNFGFSGPAQKEVIHNYIDGGFDGKTPVFSTSYGNGQQGLDSGTRDTVINIPDDIGNLVDDQGRLFFTLQTFGPKNYVLSPNDHIMFNGTRYEIPAFETQVNFPKTVNYCDVFVGPYIPLSLMIPINKSDIRKGNNQIRFRMEGTYHNCAPGGAGAFNVHLELPYDANDQNVPPYTQPLQIFGQAYSDIVRPPITTCDRYWFIERDLGLPYETGKGNLNYGPCTLMQGHTITTDPGDTTPPPPTENVPPTITVTTDVTEVAEPATINVSATGNDTDGSVTLIRILQEDQEIKTCQNATICTYTATNQSIGNTWFTAVATDNNGNETISNITYVNVIGQLEPENDLVGWTGVEAGSLRRPTATIAEDVYPNSQGVQFWINGEIDVRDSSARPNGFDATGPRENSEYHVYPNIDLSNGDKVGARWTDTNGVEHWSEVTIGQAISPDPDPSPPPTTDKFTTQPVNASLPTGNVCGTMVRPAPEVRPANTIPNNTRGVGGNYSYPRVDGNFTGTTDEIIQWAACKHGMDEDILRAQMVKESYWHQSAIGDFATGDQNLCSPVYPLGDYPPQYNGDANHTNQCPESYGLSQVRWTYHKSAFYSSPTETGANLTNNAIYSTAYNVDYWASVWRSCYNGEFTWLNTVERGKDYVAGDEWGCLGMWFSGRWYTDLANQYISDVQANLNNRIWETTAFINSQPVNTIPDTGTKPIDTTPPTITFTSPANGSTVSGTVTLSVDATDDAGVSRVSYYLDSSTTAFSNDSSPPYESSWNSALIANGIHTIKAIALDTSGNLAETTISVTVQNTVPDTTSPVATITSPANNSTVYGAISVSANASDNVGVSKVELLINGSRVATDTTAPYGFSLDTTQISDGTHELSVRAFDAAGNNTYSGIITIIVDNIPVPPELCADPTANNQGQPLPCTYDPEPPAPVDPTPTPGDVDGDNDIDRTDMRIARYYYGQTVEPFTNGDMDGDGDVDRTDLRIIRYYYKRG